MEQITKEKVIAEIKELYNDIDKCISELIEARSKHDGNGISNAHWRMETLMVNAQQAICNVIDTFETKEVDLEKEIYDYFNEWQNVLCDEDCCNEGGFCCVLDENVKPVNIERCRKVAKHFFKLGINSK